MRPKPGREAAIGTKAQGDWTRVFAELDGRDVSHLAYSPRRLQVGVEGIVRMGGIAGVATDPAFRRQGLASRVLAHAIDRMRADGYSCAGLFTSTKIVAHRLYRRHGLVDVAYGRRAIKLLDPRRFLCHCLPAMIRKDAPVRRLRPTLSVELLPHDPIGVRLEESGLNLLPARPRRADLWLAMSVATFLDLWNEDIDLRGAEGARRVRWRGDGELHRLLLDAMCAPRPPVREG